MKEVENKNKMFKIDKKFFIRSKSNIGEPCKQYFRILSHKEMESAIHIERLSLTKEKETYEKNGHHLVKTFKDKFLFRKTFSLKMGTLFSAMNVIMKYYFKR